MTLGTMPRCCEDFKPSVVGRFVALEGRLHERRSQHGVRLATASHAVSKESYVVTLEGLVHCR